MRASRSKMRIKTCVRLGLPRLYQDYGLLAQDAVYFYTCREIYATIMEAAGFCETLITKQQSHILENSNLDTTRARNSV
jgi:hypothetical protein